MTAHRARAHSRHYRPSTCAISAVPPHLAHLHPDWLPPGGYAPDGTYNDRTGDLAIPDPAVGATPPAPTPFPTGLPRELNSQACPTAPACDLATASATDALPPPPIPFPTGVPVAGNSTSCPLTSPLPPATHPVGAHGGAPASPLPLGPDSEDEDALFCDPYLYGSGRERQLSYTALPLRHRIYALHCQGRSLSAIARTLRLDRGTVARHLHATEDLLLAEQTEDLARLRLRAIEAQHAILAAAWDALLCEELRESDASNDHPYPSRRAQLLATAARAARTAAQLQGLLTPAALQAALAAATTQPLVAPEAVPSAPGGAAHGCAPIPPTESPIACNSTACPTTPDPAVAKPAATCGMLASGTSVPSTAEASPALPARSPVALNSTAHPPATAALVGSLDQSDHKEKQPDREVRPR